MQKFDAIVVGTGGMGSAALYHLSRRGLKVLGIDQHPPGHDKGSSHGQTRITRQAYFEHPDYVPLLIRAHELWQDLNRRSGQTLFHKIGLTCMSDERTSKILPDILKSSNLYNIPTEVFSARELRKKYPSFQIPEQYYGVSEPGAGYLEVEKCVKAHVQLATSHGAEFLQGQVTHWQDKGSCVEVLLGNDAFQAEKLIVTTGAWTSKLLQNFPMNISVHSAVQFWFDCSAQKTEAKKLPCFAFEIGDQFIYGFPYIDGQGLKVAHHAPMQIIPDPNRKPTTYSAADLQPVAACLKEHFPSVNPKPIAHANCMYTMSEDGHFIIDQWPESERVWFATAGNGHAFKFTSVLGEALADLAQHSSTTLPIKFLRLRS